MQRTRGWIGAIVVGVAAVLVPTAAVLAQDAGWPRELTANGHRMVYYQPQIDRWPDRRVVEGRLAVTVTPAGEKAPVAGAIWLRSRTAVDMERRQVVLDGLDVVRSNFSVVDEARRARITEIATALLPKGPITVSLDRILAGLDRAAEAAQEVPVNNDAPRIIVSLTAARLVIFDGEPVFADVPGTDLAHAVNTNWPLFQHRGTGTLYLLDDKTWLSASDVRGPWGLATALPRGFQSIPKNDNWRDVHAALPPKSAQGARPPAVYVTTTPAELIVITGKPAFADIPGTQLQAVSNTQSDLFFHKSGRQFYFLVAGRWYRAGSLDGPWVFSTRELPADFARIPAKHPKARVLASVPGTPQAQEALLVASIPVTAVVNKRDVKLEVRWNGTPAFEPIASTPLHSAVNASTTVIKLSETSYLACEKAVWFAASSPNGPWVVADSVPSVVYTIPPSSPVYNVTYVKVESSTPEQAVMSFTAGYMFGFVTAGVLVWGSGYYYPPYWVHGPVPVYYPRPYTYGAAAWYSPVTNSYYRGGYAYGPYGGVGAGAVYNPATGAYGRGFAAYGPNAGYAVGRAYNPSTGAWAQGAAGYGPNGAWRAGSGYNPQTGVFAAGAQGTNMYGSWGRGVVSRGDQSLRVGYADTARRSTAGAVTGQGTGVVRTEGARGNTTVARGQNNTYVGHDGNVYRRSDSGWQKYEDGSWSGANRPEQQPGARSAAQGAGGQGAASQRAGGQAPARTGQYGGATRPAATQERSVFDGLQQDSRARMSGQQRQQQFDRSSFNRGSVDRGGGGRQGGRRER